MEGVRVCVYVSRNEMMPYRKNGKIIDSFYIEN
jgi:hypothetical protein